MNILGKQFMVSPLVKNFFAYAIGAVVLKSMTSVTALITLHRLSVGEFGLLALINTMLRIVPVFLSLGIRQAFWLEYFHCDQQRRNTLLNQSIMTYIGIAAPFVVLGLCCINTINDYVFLGQATTTVILIGLIYCFLQFFSELYLQILRYQMRAFLLIAVQLGAATLIICANIALVFWLNLGVTGVVLANTLGIAAICLIGAYGYRQQKMHLHITTHQFGTNAKNLLVLGFPFIPNMVIAWLLAAGNRWFLAYLTSMELLGIYALADMAGQAFAMCVLEPISSAYVPHMLQQYASQPDNRIAIERSNRRFMWIAMAVAMALISLATIAAYIVGPWLLPPRFTKALHYVWFILLANVLLMGTYFSSCYLVFAKKAWTLLGLNSITAILSVGLSLLLIPFIGIAGCVVSSLVAYSVFFVLNQYAFKRVFYKAEGRLP